MNEWKDQANLLSTSLVGYMERYPYERGKEAIVRNIQYEFVLALFNKEVETLGYTAIIDDIIPSLKEILLEDEKISYQVKKYMSTKKIVSVEHMVRVCMQYELETLADEEQIQVDKDDLYTAMHTKVKEICLRMSHIEKRDFVHMSYSQRQERKFIYAPGQKIGYIKLCGRCNIKGHVRDLYRDTTFERLCTKLFGEEEYKRLKNKD